MPKFQYRLQPLLEQKIELKQQAEEALAARQKEVREQEHRLEELRARRRDLETEKLRLRMELLTAGGSAGLNGMEIRQRVDWVRAVEQEAESAKDDVFSQELAVEDARDRVKQARAHLAECSREAEILNKHRERSEQRFLREVERKEALEQEEVGTTLFLSRRRSHEDR